MQVVTVGDNCIDDYEDLQTYYPTGNSVDVAIHLKQLGIPVSIVSVTGDDGYGNEMVELLENHLIDVTHFHQKPGKTAVTKMGMKGNDRVHLKYFEGVLSEFTLRQEDIEFISKHEIVHSSVWGKVDGHLQDFQAAGAMVMYDFSTKLEKKRAETILPMVDYAFFSYQDHDDYIENYMKWAKKQGPQVVIVTLGSKGSLAFDGETFYKEGIVDVPVVNTVGAGDSFIAGYIRGVIEQKSISACLKSGASVAAQVVQIFAPY
ncbi:fructoselysine 6-kinase [Domibacillus robiginosus]|uniref:fructoselysine 6-kinase n=1 Tax=Domibacillus robiginosus TaxID=1071054 RepID=UPI00067B7840|nr:fructoselysine 6-kinase [Domibacillus robiginosus]